MANRDIIVVGASAGGVEALRTFAGSLPEDLPAAVFIVLHLPAQYPSHLAAILGRSGPLPVADAVDGGEIQRGNIYVAPPGFHLLVGAEFMSVARGPRINRSRPSIDLLFQSASASYGARVIGVLLSGMLDDGTRGLATIKRRGGCVVVQDPDEALFASMPRSAVQNVSVDRILPVAEMGTALQDLVAESPKEDVLVREHTGSNGGSAPEVNGDVTREISPFTCPECSGTLWEIEEGAIVHYQCRVGHAFSPSNLLAAQVDEVESLLWAGLRAMEERESLYRMMLTRNNGRGIATVQTRIEAKLETNRRHAELLRQILLDEEATP
jgi:two-component system chemotaxis response regulator CheB